MSAHLANICSPISLEYLLLSITVHMYSWFHYYIDAEIYVFYENLIRTAQAGLFFFECRQAWLFKKHKDVIGGFIFVVNVYSVFFVSG